MSPEKFPLLAKNAKQMMSLFGNTYVCEELFSTMKLIKNDHRSRLSDARLESCVRVATSSIPADIDQLVSKKQCQISHKKFQVNLFFCYFLVSFYIALKFVYETFTFLILYFLFYY